MSTFGISEFQTLNNIAYPKFQTPNKPMSTPVSKVKEFLPWGEHILHIPQISESESGLMCMALCYY